MKGWNIKAVKKLNVIGEMPVEEKKAIKNNIKAAWREVGGRRIYFRSLWEANFGRYLQFLKKNGQIEDWAHEPQTFWFEGIKRGHVSYLPDFSVTLKDKQFPEYYEVKGYMDKGSLTKIKRFRKYYPHLTLHVADKMWFETNVHKICKLIPDWEYGTRK